ncbi:hypothetical protein, partial [Streptomyces minutiscleroticus]|uniref:hypothetical protein n=1 Tax=Streptomyces minutiscleroticus TaxID=68238 RepID=UPI00332C5226
MAGTSSVHVRGNVEGQVVVGTRNVVQTVVVNADRGSSVTVRPEGPPLQPLPPLLPPLPLLPLLPLLSSPGAAYGP